MQRNTINIVNILYVVMEEGKCVSIFLCFELIVSLWCRL